MAKVFRDASIIGTHVRVGIVIALIILLPPSCYFGVRELSDEANPGARFDNELVADARKDVLAGARGMWFLGMLIGAGVWLAHRNRHSVRVSVDDDGILYHSMFREVRAAWDEITGFERVGSGRFGAQLRIRTRQGSFLVSPAMADSSEPPPRVTGGAGGLRLHYSDGREEAVTPEHNPLLSEIRARLSAFDTAGPPRAGG
jgi:hypothetical protein